MLRFRHATRASQGARSYQEDAAAVWPSGTPSPVPRDASPAGNDARLVTILADGMGGHAGGAIASQTICAAFLQTFAQAEGRVADRLQTGLSAANAAIAEKISEKPALAGMGATLVGVAFGADCAEWVSVGDSPLYLIRRGEIARLNEDHSLAPMLDRLVANGRLSPEQAKADPRRHYLRAAVSGEDIDLIDASQRPLALQAGDAIVVASDGIHTLEDKEIARVVGAYLPDGPEAAAAALIRAVDGAADTFQDNTTVIVISVEQATL
ncbi:MAG: PP2C family protein-serine/threonine phosphatase [Bacteroidota bacterium]